MSLQRVLRRRRQPARGQRRAGLWAGDYHRAGRHRVERGALLSNGRQALEQRGQGLASRRPRNGSVVRRTLHFAPHLRRRSEFNAS